MNVETTSRDKIEAWVCASVLAVAIAVTGFLALKTSFLNPWLSQSDPASYANLAKNLISGRGYTADYLYLYFRHYPAISHAEDTWPPMMPMMMAASFLVFGVSAWAARIPTLLAWLAISIIAYIFASRRPGMGHTAGLIAGTLILAHRPFFNAAAMSPINDVAFAAAMFPGLWLVYRSRDEEIPGKMTIFAALLTALSIYLKFQGGLLAMAFVVWNFQRDNLAGWAKKCGVFLLLLTLLGLPLFVRNMKAFGSPFYPNTQKLNLVSSTWDTPFVWWNNRRLLGRVWYDNPMTWRRAIKEKGATAILLIKPAQRLKAMARGMIRGSIVSLPMFIWLIPGIIFLTMRERKFVIYLSIVFLLSTTIVIVGHHEDRYFWFLTPWAAVLAAWGYMSVIKTIGSDKRLVYLLVAALVIGFSVSPARYYVRQYESFKNAKRPFSYEKMISWICNNTPPGSAFMAFSTFELAYECGRPTAWIPNEPYPRVESMMKEYGVKYLLLENLEIHEKFFSSIKRDDIYWTWFEPLNAGREALGYKKLFEIPGEYIVYETPWAQDGSAK